MDIPQNAIGPITAASVTGVIALLGLIVSKEQKISEFRHDWIKELRTDIAKVVAHAGLLEGAIDLYKGKGEDPKEMEKFIALIRPSTIEAEQSTSSIRLRINPAEHKDLVKILDSYETAITGQFDGDPDEKEELIEKIKIELISTSQLVLKKEWERVKRGEFMYRGACWITGLAAATGLILLLLK